MSKAKKHNWLILFFFLSFQTLYSQDNDILQRPINIQFQENTFLGHIDKILIQDNIIIAFNSSRVDLNRVIRLPSNTMLLEEIIDILFQGFNINLLVSKNKVTIVFLNNPEKEEITINGYIRDSETGEAIVGASLVEFKSNSSTFSNEDGFYSLSIPATDNEVHINYLGYKPFIIKDIEKSSLNIDLVFDNLIDQITIEGSVSDNFLLGSGSEKIDLAQTRGFQSSSGDNDLIRAVRTSPKVQSGNEGQLGMYVRGGSPDQNLILFEGIPLYEVSHTAGFSSIFIEESIKDVDFITNGFPARYGGRLSSVMNVRLKDGNQSGYNGSVKLSLPAIKGHIEGPLFSDRTTFNLAGRVSFIDQYINPLIGDLINYENIDLNYHDIVGKLTHRFTNSKKLSFSYYTGMDNIGLRRLNSSTDDEGSTFTTDSNNAVEWGSTVWNLKYTDILTDNLQLTANIGGISYNNNSRADFRINSIQDNLESYQELELVTSSQIDDQMFGINLDYYFNDKHRFKIGGSWIRHEYNPAIFGSDTITTGPIITITSEENIILADELSFYVEDTYRPNEQWQIYGGVHLSGYNIGLEQYRNLQPRFSTVFTPDSINRFTVSYANMVQYVHMLVNPGIGLPADFWIPSTETFRPSSARQVSFEYARKLNNTMELSLGGYLKSINNLLDYRNAVDLFFEFVNSSTRPTIQLDPEWRNFVVDGGGNSRGLEFQIRKTAGTFTGWASYAYARTTRQFDEINEGRPFSYKFDRRHDINLGLMYRMNERFSLAINWVYGTGNAFSLANEKILTPFNQVILVNSGERNNFRFPAFHHLDIQLNYEKEMYEGKFIFNLGIYNIYNRKNAYYIYVYNNTAENRFITYKTSLFPFLPNMSIGYSF